MSKRRMVTLKTKYGKATFLKNKKVKPILWVRELACGHERDTDVAYAFGDYKKPKIGSYAYCRECCKDMKIIRVKMTETVMQMLERMIKEAYEKAEGHYRPYWTGRYQALIEVKAKLEEAGRNLSLCRPDSESNWVDWETIKKELGLKETGK